MKIAVIGNTGNLGVIGSKVIALLRAHGHEAISPALPPHLDSHAASELVRTLRDTEVLVDTSWSGRATASDLATPLEHSLPSLLQRSEAGIGRRVALSVVGADRHSGPLPRYLAARRHREELVQEFGQPFTIVRATQCFEQLVDIAESLRHGGEIRVPSVLAQPMAADDVSAELVAAALAPPLDRIVEVAGPETFRLDALLRRVVGREDTVVSDPRARYQGMKLDERALLPTRASCTFSIRFGVWKSSELSRLASLA